MSATKVRTGVSKANGKGSLPVAGAEPWNTAPVYHHPADCWMQGPVPTFLRETERIDGLDIAKIIGGPLSTKANCKEAVTHL